ncbi:hypothetical protein BKA62DRAFT_674911 [Auriculariales sp. MPI-PUGE-AT-0066]|nr:hypothetical protein BKA62DRAFT_674911 [Auriculariales sp. MPI-PUGE-AT-0066]
MTEPNLALPPSFTRVSFIVPALVSQMAPPSNMSTSSEPDTAGSCLPVELVCLIIETAATTHRDSALSWTAQLALLNRFSLPVARAAIYELYVVGRRAVPQDPTNQFLASSDPSIREFVTMIADESDPRRIYVKCIVFALHPENLGLASVAGCLWTVDTVVCASEEDDEDDYPPMNLQIRRFVSCFYLESDGSSRWGITTAMVAYDINLASMSKPIDEMAEFYVHVPDPKDEDVAQMMEDVLDPDLESAMMMVFSPGADALSNSAAIASSRAKIASTATVHVDKGSAALATQRLRWSNADWTVNLTQHPVLYRTLLCSTERWDEGEPLLKPALL